MRRLPILLTLLLMLMSIAAQPLAAQAAGRKVALGVSVEDNRNLATLDAFTLKMGGISPAIWSLWSDWGGDAASASFPDVALMDGIVARRAVPMFFWNPVDPTNPASRAYNYPKIIRGDHDAYIRLWAQDAKAWGKTVLLKFANEMNGDWFPWSVGKLGNTATGFRKAWRRIHDLIRGPGGEGATNVKMVWAPYGSSCQSCLKTVYPGDSYVEYAGFSAFDWKAQRSMKQLFAGAYKAIRAISTRKIIVSETGTPKSATRKAAWIKKGYPEVYTNYPAIVAIVYFDYKVAGQPDWRLAKPQNAITAYAAIVAKSRFQGRIAL